MSDENETPDEGENQEAQEPEGQKEPAAVTLQKDVKLRVEETDAPGGENSARERVIKKLAEDEVARRTSVLSDALSKRQGLDKNLKQIKPTFVQSVCQETGKETKVFTKAELDQRKKLSDKLKKLDKAINAVIETPSGENYGKLKDVAAKS